MSIHSTAGNSTTPVVVDDSDPSVQYGSGWAPSGLDDLAHNNTLHATCSSSPGSISFNGTSIKVFGKVPDTSVFGLPNSTYFVDGRLGGTFLAPSSNESLDQLLFFSQDGLSPTTHTLTFNLNNGRFFSANKGGQSICMLVDFFEYTPLPGPAHDQATRYNALAIAGIALASLATVMGWICAVLLWRKIKLAKRRNLVGPSRSSDALERGGVRPFVLSRRFNKEGENRGPEALSPGKEGERG